MHACIAGVYVGAFHAWPVVVGLRNVQWYKGREPIDQSTASSTPDDHSCVRACVPVVPSSLYDRRVCLVYKYYVVLYILKRSTTVVVVVVVPQ